MKLDKNYGYIIVADDDNLYRSSQLDGDDFREFNKMTCIREFRDFMHFGPTK